MLLRLYIIISYLLYPLIAYTIHKRKIKGKEDILRIKERYGLTSIPRPKDKLIWLHGASVGESLSMLPLIEIISKNFPFAKIMVTTGTITSAKLLEERLPENAFHQYIPIDYPVFTKRFIKHWQPDCVLWFESDFWPNIIHQIGKNNIPLILINGRVSDKSFKRWQKFKFFIKELLSNFKVCLGQTKTDAERLKILGAKKTLYEGNIKFAAAPLPFNVLKLAYLVGQTKGRILILASSTHPKEEVYCATAYKELKSKFPSLLLIIVPRHAHRGIKIAQELKNLSLKISLRSKNEPINKDTDIYIADTMGELGLFYRLCEIVFIGGSLIPHGGQNFLESFRLKTAVIIGNYMHNFKEMTSFAIKQDALIQVQSKDELSSSFGKIIANKELKDLLINNSYSFAENESLVLNKIYDKIDVYLRKALK